MAVVENQTVYSWFKIHN